MKNLKRTMIFLGAAAMLTSALALNASAGRVYSSVPGYHCNNNNNIVIIGKDGVCYDRGYYYDGNYCYDRDCLHHVYDKNYWCDRWYDDDYCYYRDGYFYDGTYYYYTSANDTYENYRYVRGSSHGIIKYDREDAEYIIRPNSSTLAKKPLAEAAENGVVFKNGADYERGKVYTSIPSATICSGIYYTNADLYIKNYFSESTYDITMKLGEERAFSDDVLFYSLDSSVVSYDSETGNLVAEGVGSTYVYAYTKSGLPFMRLSVKVTKTGTVSSPIYIYPDCWQLGEIGANTGFVVKTPSKYSDIVYSVVFGQSNAYLKDGKLIATGYGPVVVRAYSKANPKIYGDTIIYVGKYNAPVYDGYWYNYGNDICVNTCPYDIWNSRNCTVNGWIKSAEGIVIPVIKVQEAEVKKPDGTTGTTTIVSGGSVSLGDILKDNYGCKSNIAAIIDRYNNVKYGK